jgi:hypothetical protein
LLTYYGGLFQLQTLNLFATVLICFGIQMLIINQIFNKID